MYTHICIGGRPAWLTPNLIQPHGLDYKTWANTGDFMYFCAGAQRWMLDSNDCDSFDEWMNCEKTQLARMQELRQGGGEVQWGDSELRFHLRRNTSVRQSGPGGANRTSKRAQSGPEGPPRAQARASHAARAVGSEWNNTWCPGYARTPPVSEGGSRLGPWEEYSVSNGTSTCKTEWLPASFQVEDGTEWCSVVPNETFGGVGNLSADLKPFCMGGWGEERRHGLCRSNL